jgi:hypothetical protein
MKTSTLGIVLVCAAVASACGKKASSDVSGRASAEASVKAAPSVAGDVTALAKSATGEQRVELRIGGSFVMVGEFRVELAVHRAGLVEAVVTAPDGKLVSDGKLSVSASARSGASEPIALAFNAARARFEGRAQAGVELRSGMVELRFELDGKVREGTLALALALEPPRIGGSVLATGAFGVEALALASGDVFALVRNANGAAVNADLEVGATVTLRAGGSERVRLTFDAPRALFTGKASAELAPGALGVEIRAGGNVHQGALARIDLSARTAGEISAKAALEAELAAGGLLGAGAALAAKAGADAAANATAKAGAVAKVQAPAVAAKAGAKVQAPSVAAKVQVKPPSVSVSTKKTAGKTGASGKASAGFSLVPY